MHEIITNMKYNLASKKASIWAVLNLFIDAEGLGISVQVVVGARPSASEQQVGGAAECGRHHYYPETTMISVL